MIHSYPIFSTILIALALRPLLVLLHELGHGVAAYRFIRQKITIFLGSYGEKEKSADVELGDFRIWFTSNPFLWQRGICIPSQPFYTTTQRIVYVLAGPFAPVVFAAIVLTISSMIPMNEYMQKVINIFCGVALLDLFYNLVPNSKPVMHHEGQPVFNDGYALKLILTERKYPDEYFTAMKQFDNKEYEEATKNFEWAARRLPNDEIVHKNLALCYRIANNFEALRKIYAEFPAKKFTMDTSDLLAAGFACSHLNDHGKAMDYYEKALQLDPLNKYAINNKAFTMQVYGKLEESIDLLDSALSIDSDFDDAINNRGYARIKLGDVQGGLEDINRARELNPDNSYVYRNLGIYHKMNGDNLQALAMFRKAKELDPITYNIELLIDDVKAEVS